MKKNLLVLLGAFVALTSCSTDKSSVAPAGKNEISFTLDGIMSRVVDNQFETGDAISVNAFENAALYASAEYSYSNGTFTSASPIAYDGSDSKSLSYHAAYPAVENFSSAFTFEVAEDQTGEGYEASDLLVANVAATTDVKPALSFYHTMSNIIINVNGTNVASSAIVFNAQKSVACDITAATYVANGDAAAITAAKNGNVGFKAVLAPQTFAAGQTIATLTTSTGVYEWTVSADKVFQSGKQYLYTWTVDEVTGENSIEFSGLINDWDSVDGGEINGGSEGGNEGGDVTPDQGDSKTITFDGTELPTAYPADETITVDGFDFVVNLVANFSTQYETSGPIQFKKAEAYLYNSTAIKNITEVVITLAPEGTQYNNFVVYAGDTAYPTAIEATSSQEGDVCTDYIPEGSEFISVVNPSNYTAYAFQIDVVVGDGGDGNTGESGNGGTGEGGNEGGNEGGENVNTSSVEIFASDFTNGGDNTDNGQDGFPLEDTEVVGDFTFTFVDGSTATRNWWYKEAWQLRFYTGSVTTISSEKTITKIEFDGYPEFTSEDGAYADRVWEGSSNSVVFNGTKSGKVNKITITYAE